MSTTFNNIDAVRGILGGNRSLTAPEVSEEVGISIGSCHAISTEKFNLHSIAAKFKLSLLTNYQKELLDRGNAE